MKYKLFRSPGDLDKAVRKHELVAVETGKALMMWQTRLSVLFGMILRKCRSMRTVKPLRMHRNQFGSIAA